MIDGIVGCALCLRLRKEEGVCHGPGVDYSFIVRDVERYGEEYATGYEYLRLGTVNPTETVKQIEAL